jgi:hypothetical protein
MGMIGSAKMQLGALDMEQFLQKIIGKSGISVINNRMRHAMKHEYIIHENLSNCGGYEWVLEIAKISIFGKNINYHHYE